MYTNFLFVYPASSVGKRVTSTKELNIFLEQVSIILLIFVKLSTVSSPLFSCYLKPELSEQSDPPKQPIE